MKVRLFDTTLRDGTQGEGLSLSVEDKLRIAQISVVAALQLKMATTASPRTACHASPGCRAPWPRPPTCGPIRRPPTWARRPSPRRAESTEAKTRVLIEAARGEASWSTIGVSRNIIEASCEALADSFELHLLRTRDEPALSNNCTRA